MTSMFKDNIERKEWNTIFDDRGDGYLVSFLEKNPTAISEFTDLGNVIARLFELQLTGTLKYMFEHGVDINTKTSGGDTPLIILINSNHPIETCIYMGADTSITDANGRTPLELYTEFSKWSTDVTTYEYNIANLFK